MGLSLRRFCSIALDLSVVVIVLARVCTSGPPRIGQITPGFEASQMDWIDYEGRFLLSNDSAFSLGFYTGLDVTTFLLNIIHTNSSKVIWTANRGQLIGRSDKFVFGDDGNVYLQRGNGLAWSTGTAGQGASALSLLDTGNLVLLGADGGVLWQSFSHPTDTLISGQEFTEGMRLKSFPKPNNLSVYLEILSGDLVLYAGYRTPQAYWSLSNDSRRVDANATGNVNGSIHSVSLESSSWNFYNLNKVLISRLIFSDNSDPNALWAAILGSDGTITFHNLHRGKSVAAEAVRIPQNFCSVPEPCNPYNICYFENWCQCPPALSSSVGCQPQLSTLCGMSHLPVDFLYVAEKLDYFALDFMIPSLKSNVNTCIEACRSNCSCNVLLFDSSSGKCYLFDQIGSFQRSDPAANGYVSYMKITNSTALTRRTQRKKHEILIVIIVIVTIGVIATILFAGLWYFWRKDNKLPEDLQDNFEEDNLFDSLSGMPVRYSFLDLRTATKDFSMKVGQGGFGSVYMGELSDGSRVAVKRLEAVGQGKKEFRAEVTIIGSIHHVHLARLKGFCSEGAYRLLVYEFMANGSLDKWIFSNGKDGNPVLGWETRFSIALGTAKGLAYLHEECELKIVHCDVKPENVLLDDNFVAKVSDFGLAKLMSREESLVYTTLRGTRGYLAPEWITNNPISEKSDVYSYGMVLLEIIGGRKNYDPGQPPARAHLPTFAYKMMEEGRPKEIVDSRIEFHEDDERFITSIQVALWCIQDEMHLRPPMTKVVQMLEGLCAVPKLPATSPFTSHSSYGFLKWSSEETSTGMIDWSSDALLSEVQLSGPR
ncbi:hypothetical protein MLD38_030667 [Melastoma candidum]|uniref:Uncharacterized protein n=1 Tax=Melastoma candidum TaxID=119954 RepID=A0ACB9MMD3_9MYRT|nr:hypothetical protein MLD38_030667 [Melastoma candidum]